MFLQGERLQRSRCSVCAEKMGELVEIDVKFPKICEDLRKLCVCGRGTDVL